jgi:AcrR family transcriptional regulator
MPEPVPDPVSGSAPEAGRATGRGRRRGAPDTRAEILGSARTLFAERGFARTSVRAVAAAAGVDPALVHHYFGSKDDLFMAALEIPVDPRELLAPVVAAGVDGAAERMLRVFLSVWDDPAHRLPLLGLVRSVLEPAGERLLREGFVPVVLVPIGQGLGIDHPEVRMPLVASQILGLILVRYLLAVEPVASMDEEQVVAHYAPVVQRFLSGPLPA